MLIRKLLNKLKNEESGFTLIEVIVSTGIILTLVTAFTVFMTETAETQRTANFNKIADRFLAQEVERTYGITWDNLMMSPAGSYSNCLLPDNRVSTQALNYGPENFSTNGTTVSVTKQVKWLNSDTLVSCTLADKDRPELKKVIVTATWLDKGQTKTKTVVVLRSRWAEIER